jgi:tetratricopeptide (TPR) repeat protein
MLPSPPKGHLGRVCWPLIVALMSWGAPSSGQEALPLQRDYPGPGPFVCPPGAQLIEPSTDERERAGQLASDALQAQILGDLEGARTLLSQAAGADGTSAEIAYRHARVLEDLGLADAAISEYCRSLALGAVDAGIVDARRRLDVLYEIVRERISETALAAFISGLDQADAMLYADAAASFAVAIEESPLWPAAVYNRAIVLEQLGLITESVAEFRRYLQLTPSEVDPTVVDVSARIGMLEGVLARPTPSPGNALAFGALFPGMGQYYAGRNLAGTIVVGAAVIGVTTGLMYKDITVVCLVPVSSSEDCPAGQVHDEITKRPFLKPALGVSAAVMVGAAVEAYLRARRERAEQQEQLGVVAPPEVRGPVSAVRLVPPSITASRGRVDLNLLGLRFR